MGEIIASVFILLFIAMSIVNELYARHIRVPAFPSLPFLRWRLLKYLRRRDDLQHLRVAELGCGWGGLVRGLARLKNVDRVIGYELSPIPFAGALLLSSLSRKMSVRHGNFFEAELVGFDIFVCYLRPDMMNDVYEKAYYSNPNGLLISVNFPVEGVQTIETIKASPWGSLFIYDLSQKA